MKWMLAGAGPLLAAAAGLPAEPQAGWTPAHAPGARATLPEDFDSSYLALCDEFETAQEEHYAAFQEKWGEVDFQKASPEEQAKIQQWWRDNDPSARFITRFSELAAKAKGTDAAVRCWGKVLELAPAAPKSDGAPGPASGALAALKECVGSPAIEEVAAQLQHAWGLPRAEVIALLALVREKSPHKSAQAAATFSLALQYMSSEASAQEQAQVRALLGEFSSRFSSERPARGRKSYAELAVGHLFEFEHLQVGMLAPDEEALDVDGVKFKLSDFRGKVTVVDFWGYW